MICIETAKKYCKNYQKIENYEKAMDDKTQIWICHHHSSVSKRAISEKNSKHHWFTNGITSVKALSCPEGFRPGRVKNWH